MPRPRLPEAKAKASGAGLINPARFKDRKAPKRTRPLGEPYVSMTDLQKAAWYQLASEIPWLTSSHRALVRIAATINARFDAGEEVGVAAMQALSAVLSKMGATPADETKVNHGDDGDEDPADQFFNRSN